MTFTCMALQRFTPIFVAGSCEDILGFLEARHVTLSHTVLYNNVVFQNNFALYVCLGAF